MPCYDARDSLPHYREDPETRRRLDAATRVACEVLGLLPHSAITRLTPEARRWWERHQEEDRRREAAMRARGD